MMNPLEMKNTNTPNSPGRNTSTDQRRYAGQSISAPCCTATDTAAIPRNASRNSRRPFRVAACPSRGARTLGGFGSITVIGLQP
jgi:hypothetical protein